MLTFPGQYNSSLQGYCNCSEPVQGPDATNDPEDRLFLAENLPTDCAKLRSPLVQTLAPGAVEKQADAPLQKGFDQAQIRIQPNPNDGRFRVLWHQGEPQSVNIWLFDAQGQLMEAFDLGQRPAGSQEAFLQFNPTGPGLYLLRLQVGRAQQVLKVMIQ
ncbi:MAG: T9SS type A sorting domain-containing protein [Phaeodactylibacter sp.]|nr:T9SS type A sorting domain-containing protein [Phaeodactylibacter sp.]